MDQWRDIESAPKDGTTLLLWSKKARYKPIVGKWVANWNSWQSQPGAWTAYPTHWMPLPEPPEIESVRRMAGNEG